MEIITGVIFVLIVLIGIVAIPAFKIKQEEFKKMVAYCYYRNICFRFNSLFYYS